MEQSTKPRRRRRLVRLVIPLLLAALLLGCALWLSDAYRADGDAIAAFSPGPSAQERTLGGGDLCFGAGQEAVGLIFYPGGKVDHAAYTPLMRALAEQGVFCVILKVPLRLAVLSPNAADGIPEAFPGVGSWYLGGHSLGGVMAASYLAGHPNGFEGLILLASYSTADLTETGARVLSLRGSEDGVLDREKYEQSLANLPADFREVVLEGGCHAGFGMYGPQAGDGVPTVTAEEQIRAAAAEILAWLGRAPEGRDGHAEAD